MTDTTTKAKKPKTGGRTKGTPNKTTSKAREIIADITEDNAENFRIWLGKVAADDPEKAANLYLKMLEYSIPKLSRQDINTDTDKSITVNIVDY